MKQLQLLIFAIALSVASSRSFNGQEPSASQSSAKSADKGSEHQIFGIIRSVKGSQLTVETRDKRMVKVDATAAIKASRTAVLAVDGAINVAGTYDAKGVLRAETIQRAKSSPAIWPADR